MTKETLTELKKLRDYLASTDYTGNEFDIKIWLHICVIRDQIIIGSAMLDFLFHANWANYDNTVEGAIGRIDAVLDGLRF